ncbi:hypothetical protein O3P69_013235 [Scylla paramamosain]|uniref:Estradiol 17-beta-dehydrogenase 2 n=1 Tax=Scylla paramamosain TaxID=85552 RepID=A0AAW0U3U3_SCYPA
MEKTCRRTRPEAAREVTRCPAQLWCAPPTHGNPRDLRSRAARSRAPCLSLLARYGKYHLVTVHFLVRCCKMLWTMDKGTRVAFWGGVSALLATFLDAFGLASCRLVFPVAWLLTAAAYLYRASLTVSPQGKSVVVTGCDSGFGHALALHLHKLGFRVFAGCLDANGEGAASLKRHGSNRLVVLQMDVTNQEQLVKAAQEVKKQLPGEEGLWGLVNNAGLCTLGPVEWLSLKNFKRDPEARQRASGERGQRGGAG